MYYHIRLDKIFPTGSADMPARQEWDFRSLRQGLAFVKREFGAEAQCWRIEDLTERKSDLMTLESDLKDALESTHQYVIMALRENADSAKRYDSFQFFVVARDENERPPAYTYSAEDEQAITAPATIFQPDYKQSVRDMLKSFDLEEGYAECLDKAAAAIAEFYGDEDDIPDDVRSICAKGDPCAADYIVMADECQGCGEEQIAVMLYVAALGCDGPDVKIGEALAKLAELYMNSDWPKSPGRECDVMKAMDLLVEALCRGYAEAKTIAECIREQLFDEYAEDDRLDTEDVIGRYEVDAVCFAGFCLGVGLGWKKDTVAAAKLYEHALNAGYERASHYLNEIRTGRV